MSRSDEMLNNRYNRFLDREFNYSATEETRTVAGFGEFLRKNNLQKWNWATRMHVLSMGGMSTKSAERLECIISMEYLRDHRDLYELWIL